LSHRAWTIGPMQHFIELWFWRVTDPVSQRRYVTRHRLNETDAIDLDPNAERVPGSMELRPVPEGSRALRSSSFQP
jgi:hypothetical protein